VLEYASALFSEDTIRAMAGRFVRLAEAFAADPDARLDSADMLLPGERRWLLNSGIRQRSLDLPPGSDTIPGLFAAQAARTPDAVAVKSSAGSVSYRELATRAERLARQLAAAGVTHESPVAIRMERSAELVVALLAVLIAGGAYLPVDGRYPEGVVRQMLADANARVLITDRATPASASDIATLRMEAGGASGPGIDPVRPRHPDQLAFIMYTSGSTGAAKGVGVTHRDVIAFTAAGDWRNGAHQRVLMHSATGFDASTAELWVPLLTGGTVIAAPAGKLGVRALADTIEAEGVTAIVLTAALFRLLADEQVRCLAGVREVWAGGDVVPAETVRLVLREFPAITVVNGYGPTETTTFATVHPMSSPASVPDELPIGRPIACTRAYLLDDALSQVPPGVQGELCLGGPQVARGYLGLPGLTAAAFVPDPFGPPGSRMYRTGDLARWRPDGTLAFLGRMDAQVKIRGFRIEPAGVEAVLTRHPSVRSAAVIASQERPRQPGGPADKRLVAYVVPEGQVDVAELRAHVALLLPDYMHPAAYVCLDALPLNAHGKLDRAALPAADLAAPANEAYTAPRTPVERQIAWIWERTTGVEAGIHHDFFEIGGNSLLSARVIAAVEREFGVNVDLQAIFDHPTIAGLALVVEDAVRADIGQLTEAELLAYHARISGNSSGGGE
jgi:aspartate racemase